MPGTCCSRAGRSCRYAALLEPPATTVIDGEGLYASAGLIELHAHGAGGHDFMDGTQEAYDGACETHLRHGVTTILPTTVAASDREYRRTIDSFREARRSARIANACSGCILKGRTSRRNGQAAWICAISCRRNGRPIWS